MSLRLSVREPSWQAEQVWPTAAKCMQGALALVEFPAVSAGANASGFNDSVIETEPVPDPPDRRQCFARMFDRSVRQLVQHPPAWLATFLAASLAMAVSNDRLTVIRVKRGPSGQHADNTLSRFALPVTGGSSLRQRVTCVLSCISGATEREIRKPQ